MTKITKPMLQRAGEALYGSRWQTDLSADLNVADRTMRRWVADQATMPQGAWIDLAMAVDRRADQIVALREAMEMLIGKRPYVLRPIPHSLPSYDISGLHFAMKDPDGKDIHCMVWRSVFDDRHCSSSSAAIAYFNLHFQRFYAAASALYVLDGLEVTGLIAIGEGDVVLP
jgi:hypothetical protein